MITIRGRGPPTPSRMLADAIPPPLGNDLLTARRQVTRLEEVVADARTKGVTWGALSKALGRVTKQAVHARFASIIDRVS
jgi:hypothetical protein